MPHPSGDTDVQVTDSEARELIDGIVENILADKDKIQSMLVITISDQGEDVLEMVGDFKELQRALTACSNQIAFILAERPPEGQLN